MRLKITKQYTDSLFCYKWEVFAPNERLRRASGYAMTLWGAKFAAKRFISGYIPDEVVFDEELEG